MFKVEVKRADMSHNSHGKRFAWYTHCDICDRFLMNSRWTHSEALDYAHTHLKSHLERLENSFK